MADTDQGSKNTRQKIIIILFVLVAGFVAWQVFGMFGGSSSTPATETKVAAAAPPPPPMPTPKPAELPAAAPALTPKEMELMQLQQETEAKYLAALNELQMLRVQRDIAQTNKDIASAKLDTVSAEKNIVSLLAPPEAPNNYAQRLANPTQGAPTGPENGQQAPIVQETAYTVISVTEIQGQWAAVVGAQGKLYNVHVGDVIPVDNSKVISINRGGVILQKGTEKRTISLVPII